ncbi:hypothetical protein Poly51_07980 [Rubripirellula tenax]|uniref:Uncharacterized protein n=1 Tax=Rubripirellula tenax TaxID=2528015 RepID=A0A5C6FLY6_9BACT|nr:hypothetical protein [Rubripirellula tenax]TWU60522.1 hypothetical protein Poly51_07980 [Rubripirellula tenax]
MNWQSAIASLIVAAAAAWLVRRVYRIVSSGSRDGAGQIGGCGTCVKNPNAVDATPLVSLGRKKD